MKQNWVRLLREAPDLTMRRIYQEYRAPYIHWMMKHYSYQAEEAEDFFQETLIVFYQKVITGDLGDLQYDLTTYLYAIAKIFILRDQSKNKLILVEEGMLEKRLNFVYGEDIHRIEPISNVELMTQCLEKLTEPCKNIITLYYYKRLKISQIAERLEYKNENVVKVQKKRCMDYLFKVLKNQI